MDNDTFHEEDLTDKERAILRDFDAANLEALAGKGGLPAALLEAQSLLDEDMQAIFIAEVIEDCAALQRVLQQGAGGNIERARGIQRIAHKLKGTCGAMDCTALAALALHMETLAKQIEREGIVPLVGWQALEHAHLSLEMTLEDFAASGQESRMLLDEFEAECGLLGIDLHAPVPALRLRLAPRPLAAGPSTRVDARRSEELLRHAERLTTLGTALTQAQAEVEQAFQELHAAEDRLRRQELRLTNHLTIGAQSHIEKETGEEYATSSLIARILSEEAQRTDRIASRRNAFFDRSAQAHASLAWDELEIDRFKEESVLAISLSEAIADISIAASQLRIAFAHLSRLLKEQTSQAITVRDDSLLLNLTPVGALLKRIEQEVTAARHGGQPAIQYEMTGETTEIDQDMLERLAPPLLQLIQTCLAPPGENGLIQRIRLDVRAAGSAVLIEVGFSMPIWGGALEEVEAAIQALHGSIEPGRNASGGISFYLRLPRSRGTVQALIVRVQHHTFAVPLSQVQHIALANAGLETAARPVIPLLELLGLPPEPPQAAKSEQRPAPVYLILAPDEKQRTAPIPPTIIQVDAVVSETALIVKQLPAQLQRPGISCAAIDGANNVLLLLDLPELVRHRPASSEAVYTRQQDAAPPAQAELRPPRVLVADDSVSIRQSMRHLLSHAGYHVLEALDGIEALELLRSHLPDVLILDVEMPNLNGYDLLSMMRSHPELAGVKIVMLTSRFSEKHRAHAYELGAHAYLTKPCDQETLLQTLQRLLTA